MDETVAWLQDRRYYQGQVQTHRSLPGRTADFADIDLDPRLERALARRGVECLYHHQVSAISALRNEQNVVIATPTASGKSLAYTVPAFERALDHQGRTLYIAPQRALINDQQETLTALADDLGMNTRVDVDQYTGQLSREEKRAVRNRQPHVVLMTPDLLHYGVLPNDHLWEWFFRQLDTVVIDEVHEYRGVFGSHIALIFRRLARLCERYESAPQFICCSATIGNPAEHAGAVTGQPADSFAVIDEDTSTTGPTDWLFWNPPPKYDSDGNERQEWLGTEEIEREEQWQRQLETALDASIDASDSLLERADTGSRTSLMETASADTASDTSTSAGGDRLSNHGETVRLFCDLVARGYQTLVFTRTRQGAERYADWCANRLREWNEYDLTNAITAYQAALKQGRREKIEEGLHDGSLRGVWSTNALELGVDIGGLDVVLLDGYPGTRMATHQRAGRAGRGDEPSLVTLVGGRDQLDQYLMGHPDAFFEDDPERAVVNPANDQLMPAHVLGAATESWLKPEDQNHFGETFPELVADLEADSVLERRDTRKGIRWIYAGDGSPQHEMSIRTIDDREIRLHDRLADRTIASLSFTDALRDAHPEAIYHHQGRKYEVADLDLDHGVANLESTDATHFTKPLTDKEITIEQPLDATTLDTTPEVTARFADVTYREQVTGYVRYERSDDEEGVKMPFAQPLPETKLRTRALYFAIPKAIERAIHVASRSDDGFEGAIHAVEHAIISLLPLELLCDRRDVGGLSTPLHPQVGQSAIFLYDGYPGGAGLARGGYESVERLMRETRRLLADCVCDSGCPACVQSPQCGNANDPLEKDLALELLDRLLEPE